MKAYIFIFSLIIVIAAPFGLLKADDTAIYGSGSISVEPNILIIFDTSGSMSTEDVPSAYYDPAVTYAGSYETNAVYQRVRIRKRWRWVTLTDNVENITCAAVKEALLTDGVTDGSVYDSDFKCGGSSKTLYLGNWRNYDASTSGGMDSRINVAKAVITSLIEDTEDVKFGLMRFNNNQGGRVIKDIKSITNDSDYKNELKTAVSSLTASGYTPLAETLAEAGLYFAGKKSWFNSKDSYSDDILTTSDTYTSPMDYRCQKNYVILMTDGEPTKDNDSKLKSGSYINGDTIGDYDGDSNSKDSTSYESSDYLDDVAKYLYDNDCNPILGAGDISFEDQNIITYTIGFQTDQTLLEDTALNGGGTYYNVSSISGLSVAFQSIISQIKKVNASYVSPVIPVSNMNRTYAGNSLYLGFFMPTNDGLWAGNVKKYGLDSTGNIIDANGTDATEENGTIKNNAQSYWSNSEDGPNVIEGGLGGLLLDNANRKLYTYLGSQLALTHSANDFSTSNSALTAAEFDVADDAAKNAVITDIIGLDKAWKMGDVLHSQPKVVGYDTDGDGFTDESYIFVGTNRGMMHAFKDSDGSEAWGFIPREQLSRLSLLSDNITDHDYFMDGSPIVYDDGTHKTLLFGERRGGYNYYALDVTTPESPVYKYVIDQSLLAAADSNDDGSPDGTVANLGQSWTSPSAHTIKSGTNDAETVFLMAGGYDINQDLDTPASSDAMGKAVFTVKIDDGALSALNFNAVNFSDMTHCITDVMGFDSSGDTYTNRVYAGDLGGNIWAFEDDDNDLTDGVAGGDGTWGGRKLFSAGAIDNVQRKIFYAPDVVAEPGEDMIFFGTGDRADPEEKGVVNRIYAIRNNWENEVSFTTLTESDLVDVTDNLIQLGTEEEKEQVKQRLNASRGWFFRLENPGEKIVSSVIVYNKVLYFTTYEPESDTPDLDADPCAGVSGLGTSRFYAVDYQTGGAVADFSSTEEKDAEGKTVTYGKKDRSKIIGSSIASSPVIAVFSSGAKIFVGVEGGIETIDPVENITVHHFYWRQAF